MARVRLKEGGVVIHSEAETFDREPAAKLWIKTREAELAKPGALENSRHQTRISPRPFKKLVDESRKAIGMTKAQVLATEGKTSLAKRRGSTISSADWVQFSKELKVLPQTAANYLSHIAAVYQMARPVWG